MLPSGWARLLTHQRLLKPTKEYYAQTEKEILAVVLGCDRFKHYVHDRPVNVESDFKPFASVKKNLLVSFSPMLSIACF